MLFASNKIFLNFYCRHCFLSEPAWGKDCTQKPIARKMKVKREDKAKPMLVLCFPANG